MRIGLNPMEIKANEGNKIVNSHDLLSTQYKIFKADVLSSFTQRDVKFDSQSFNQLMANFMPSQIHPLSFRGWADVGYQLDNAKSFMNNLISVIDDFIKSGQQDNKFDRIFINYINSEVDILKKITIQGFIPPFWYLNVDLGNDVKLPKRLVEITKLLCEQIKTTFIEASTKGELLYEDCFDPVDTNAGVPTCSSGMEAKLQTIRQFPGLAECKEFKSSVYSPELKYPVGRHLDFERIANANKMIPECLLASISARRDGPSTKFFPIWEKSQQSFPVSRYQYNNAGKVRIVYMAPYYGNIAMSPFAHALKIWRTKFSGMWHTPDMVNKRYEDIRNQGFDFIVENDQGNFDQRMPYKLRELIIEELSPLFPDITNVINRNSLYPPYLIPDPSEVNEGRKAALLVPFKPTGLQSGIKPTSGVGTIISVALFLFSYEHVGLCNALDCIKKRHFGNDKIEVWMQGDDVITFTKQQYVKKLSLANDLLNSVLAMKSSVTIGDRFLMNHVRFDLLYPELTLTESKNPLLSFSSTARMIQQTIANENKVKEHLIAALGFTARTKGFVEYMTMLNKASKLSNYKGWNKVIDVTTTALNNMANRMAFKMEGLMDNINVKFKRIVDLSTKLNATHKNYIISMYDDNKFSKTGEELLSIINNDVQLKLALKYTVEKEKALFMTAIGITGFEKVFYRKYKYR